MIEISNKKKIKDTRNKNYNNFFQFILPVS